MKKDLMGVATSLIASGIAWYFKGPNAGLMVAAIGVVVVIAVHIFGGKEHHPSIPSSAPVHQENTQAFNPQFNPQFNISVGNSSASAAPAPAPVRFPIPKEERHNITFVDVRSAEKQQMHVFSRFAGSTVLFSAAMFENKHIQGEELLVPIVKARAIYRSPDGTGILDMSNLPWVPGTGNANRTKLEVNVPQYLLLLTLANNRRYCRSVESAITRVAGAKRRFQQPREYEIKGPIGSIEVQLLSTKKQEYAVRLDFVDADFAALPLLRGWTEL